MDANSTIRRAAPADIAAMVVISDILFQEDSGQRDPLMNHAWAKQHGQSYFASLVEAPTYLVLVAEAHGMVVGYLAGSLSEPGELRTVRAAELESMCVAPDWRSRGVGEALTRGFLAWAKERGAVWATVTAYATNAGACAFYERLGFAPHSVTLGRRWL